MKDEPVMGEPLIISPQTKVSQLLNAYPGLEDVLIAQAPIFAKLRNPVLRRTVARVATLEKAAAMAGIPVSSLVSALRKAAGHENPADYGAALMPPPRAPLSAPGRPRGSIRSG